MVRGSVLGVSTVSAFPTSSSFLKLSNPLPPEPHANTQLQIPLGRYFPEYAGGNDLQKAAKYILWKFMQENRAKLTVYPQ
jgi:hypothetical protein